MGEQQLHLQVAINQERKSNLSQMYGHICHVFAPPRLLKISSITYCWMLLHCRNPPLHRLNAAYPMSPWLDDNSSKDVGKNDQKKNTIEILIDGHLTGHRDS